MQDSMFSLAGKVAVITGGGRGIGRAIALGYARAGADVVVVSRTAAQIEDTAAKIREIGRESLTVLADVRVPDQVTPVLDKTLEHFGRVDILVNNAGGTFTALVLKTSFNGWESIIRENLTSVFICSKIIGEAMIRQKSGVIINMSSVAGLSPYPTSAPYGAAKAGIINFTKTLAVEWAEYGIRVNAIAPGLVPTASTDRIWDTELAQQRKLQIKRIPLGRFATPEDIVGTAVFLASEASAYITGTTIEVNGGLTTTVFNE